VTGEEFWDSTLEVEMYHLKDVGEGADKRGVFHCPDYKKTTIYFNVCNCPFKYLLFSPALTEIHQDVLDLKSLNG
jgi:hypothetical protein